MFVLGVKLLAVDLLILLGRLLDRWNDRVVGLAARWMGEVEKSDIG